MKKDLKSENSPVLTDYTVNSMSFHMLVSPQSLSDTTEKLLPVYALNIIFSDFTLV